MWHARRRLRRLESSVAKTRADQADLSRRLELFEEIVAAAGVPFRADADGAGADADGGAGALADGDAVPAALTAAARGRRGRDGLLRLDVGGRQVVVVTSGDGGNPGQWWAAISYFATRLRVASVLHLERVSLPPGLAVVASRDAPGDLAVYVSEDLDSERQKTAVMAALRASRRVGWQARLGSAGAGIALLVALRALLRRAAGTVRARPAAWAAAATASVVAASAAGFLVAGAPHANRTAASGPPAAAGVAPLRPQPGQHGTAPGRRSGTQPAISAGGSPGAGRSAPAGSPRPGEPGSPGPGRTGPAPGPSPAPSPQPSPSPVPSPAPSPQPSPSRSPGGHGVCIIVLGRPVCVPL